MRSAARLDPDTVGSGGRVGVLAGGTTMGMDLVPRKKAQQATTNLHYNWSGWRFVREFAEHHGVDTSEFDGSNDGNPISAKTCRAMAKAIEDGRDEYNAAFAGESYGQDPATEHARAWRESGGLTQW